ncbi:MAG: S8 family serine peptidase [Solirubrobacteraceae bacterium]|nr:S8 family serine peptidase [Solirubrobacteraceae bacterium]
MRVSPVTTGSFTRGGLLALACFLLPAIPAAAAPQQLIVAHEPGLSRAERIDLRDDAGVDFVRTMSPDDLEVVEAPQGQADDALAELRADPDVAYAEVDSRVHAMTTDPLWTDQWALSNTGQLGGTPGADIGIASAWALGTGTGQTVAVVDGGVQIGHPDLAGQLDLADAYDYVDRDATPQDLDGHGTHVAGTIAALADNGVGVAGVAPGARILPLRVMDDKGEGDLSDVIDAFDRAGDLGVRVVNASFGGASGSQALSDVIAAHPRTAYVAAAGNKGTNNDVTPTYPCNVPLANVICVGATDRTDHLASFTRGGTNVGATTVDLFAPGLSIRSTYLGGYATLSGTSMAAPHVAGALALMFAREPELYAAQAKSKLLAGVTRRAWLQGYAVAAGRLSLRAALDAPAGVADTDEDGIVDGSDNCAGRPNGDQADADGDGIGNACDSSPEPPPVRPVTPAPVPAPTPLATPRLTALKRIGSTVKGCKARQRMCKPSSVTLRYTLTEQATVQFVLERKVCVRRRCSYRTNVTRSVIGKPGANALTVGATLWGKRLAKGSWRASVKLGTQRFTQAFTVK